MSFLEAQLIINEVLSSNTEKWLEDGTPDWVEIYNSGSSSVELTGYFLSDDASDPAKWEFQSSSDNVPSSILPGEYIVVLCGDGIIRNVFDRYYISNFKLSSSGEEVHLYDADTNIVSSMIFPALGQNESYGYNSSNELGIFSTSTLEEENGDLNFTIIGVELAVPFVALPNEIFTSPQLVTINSDSSGPIYYTLDGSNPTSSSAEYSGPFTVNSTTVIKSIVIRSATSQSKIGLRTLLFDKTHSLPVMSITSENFDRYGGSILNKKPVFDGRVWVEFTEPDQTVRIAQYADYTASGGISNSVIQMNGKIRAKEKYGKDHFDNDEGEIFPNKLSIKKVYGFLIRNTSQDWATAHMRGAFCDRLVYQNHLIEFGFEDYRPMVAYLNGEYQGVLNIREDDDSDFAKNNYPNDDVTEFEANELFNLIVRADMTDETTRNDLLEIIDLRDYYFYTFHLAYIGGSEVTEFGYQVDGEKADWIIHDEDITFQKKLLGNFMSIHNYGDNIVEYAPFKEDLVQSWCAYRSFMYDSTRVVEVLNHMEDDIESEMSSTIQFYKDFISERDLRSSFHEHMEDVDVWRNEVDTIRQIISPRLNQFYADLKTEFGLDSPEELLVSSSNYAHGTVRVQGVKLREESMAGTFFTNMPIELIAEPNLGFQFSHWEGLSTSSSEEISVTISNTSQVEAVFQPIPILTVDLHINEVQSKNDTTYSDEYGEYNDWVEIFNSGTSPVDLAGYYLSDNRDITNKYQIKTTDPTKTVVGPNEFIVFWLDKDTIQGENHVNFKLSSTDQIYLVYPDGLTILDSLNFSLQADKSFGLQIDGEVGEIYFDSPTPKATNVVITNIEILHNKNAAITLFPNPSLTSATLLMANGDAIESWELFNTKGELLLKGNTEEIEVGDLTSGVYILMSNNQSIRLIKE